MNRNSQNTGNNWIGKKYSITRENFYVHNCLNKKYKKTAKILKILNKNNEYLEFNYIISEKITLNISVFDV